MIRVLTEKRLDKLAVKNLDLFSYSLYAMCAAQCEREFVNLPEDELFEIISKRYTLKFKACRKIIDLEFKLADMKRQALEIEACSI